MHTVYEICLSGTDRKYVGRTKHRYPRQRWRTHRYLARKGDTRHAPKLYDAMRQYGVDAFTFRVLGTFEEEGAAIETERRYVATFRAREVGFNIDPGGRNAAHRADRTRRRIADKKRGRPLSPEHRAALRGVKRRPFTAEHIANMSAAQKRRRAAEKRKTEV